MNSPLLSSVALLTFAGALHLPAIASSKPPSESLIDTALLAMQAEPNSWADAFAKGQGSIAFNYRYEQVSEDSFSKDAYASTLRTVVGYKTAAYQGFTGYVEFEDLSIIGNESYSTSNRPTIADFRSTDLNQAYIDYDTSGGLIRLGRQEVLFDNQRFVGNVGWRQNHQSFDALAWVAPDDFPFAVTATYVNNVNTITGGNLRTDTYLVNASKELSDIGKLVIYGYSLDINTDASLSTLTLGARFVGDMDIGNDNSLDYTVEYANQTDNADNPVSVNANYYRLELGATMNGISFGIGQELLGSDGGSVGFSTPLATLHGQNGWADKFLKTPANGLEDTFLRIGGEAAGVKLAAIYHDFQADEISADFGTELDLVAKYRFNKQTLIGLKYANYSADTFSTDTEKIWFWVTWTPGAK